ncbi:unnamed protein product [Scytosiphon promiscuus]
MALSAGSQTVETSTVIPVRPTTDNGASVSGGTGTPARNRPLLSPIDASLDLWSEGRRERISELEAEILLHDAERPHQQHQRTEQQARKETGVASSCSGECDSSSGRSTTQTQTLKLPPTPEPTSPTTAALSPRSPPFPPTPSSGVRDSTAARSRLHNDTAAAAAATTGGRRVSSSMAGDAAARREASAWGPSRGGDGRGGGRGRVRGRSSPPASFSTLLEDRLDRWSTGWRPPTLRALPRGGDGFFSGWTHLGQPERFELVKSVNRSVGPNGGPLSDSELEWAVLCLEEAEDRMSSLDFSAAAAILENVLGRCPGLTLAYYRLALCLLAARGAHASRQAELLLECAMSLEGAENRHLGASVDLVHRILRNDAIPEAYWSEDYPRSLGDLRALEAVLDHLL